MLNQNSKRLLSIILLTSLSTITIYPSTDSSTSKSDNSTQQENIQTAQNIAQSQKEIATPATSIDKNYRNFKLISAGLGVLSFITISLCLYTIIFHNKAVKKIKKLYKNQILKINMELSKSLDEMFHKLGFLR